MKNIRKIKFKSFHSTSGKLIPITFNKNFPFKIKRIFFLHGKINKARGDHAHKKCTQLFMPISGKMLLKISTPNLIKKIFISSTSKFAILVPPKYWCSIKFLKKNSIIMVMNDRKYEFSDYIETFKEYKKYFNKK